LAKPANSVLMLMDYNFSEFRHQQMYLTQMQNNEKKKAVLQQIN